MVYSDTTVAQSGETPSRRGTIRVQLEINVSADRAWAAVKDLPNVLPRLMPQLLQVVKFTKGDGGVGSVREVRIPTGPFRQSSSLFAEAIIDRLDDSSRTEVHRIIGGTMTELYTYYQCTKSFTPAKDGKSCLAQWIVDYETVYPGKVDASERSVYAILKGLEEYLSSCDAYVGAQ